jgi:hypothetical protein
VAIAAPPPPQQEYLIGRSKMKQHKDEAHPYEKRNNKREFLRRDDKNTADS